MSILICPVCHATKNRAGNPFKNEWAVASHVSGLIITSGDRLHRSWAQQNAPHVNLREKSVPRLAEALLWELRRAMRTNTPIETPLSLLRSFEQFMHRYVRIKLESEFGSDHEAWWVKGVPLTIRQECAQRRENDAARQESYSYTYLIELKDIINKNWKLFEEDHVRLLSHDSNLHKRDFLELFTKGNEVRNRHAHPVRTPEPESERYEDDLTIASKLDEIAKILDESKGNDSKDE